MLHGDFGVALTNKQNIVEVLGPRFKNTLFLASYAALLALPLAVGFGILAAIREGRLTDRLANILALLAISMPEFFVGYLLILNLAVNHEWFPSLATVEFGHVVRRAGLGRDPAGRDADLPGHRPHAAHDPQLGAVHHVDRLRRDGLPQGAQPGPAS